MNSHLKILMIHQGADLYGSDRSFASSVRAVREKFPDGQIDVILPYEGPLIELIHPFASNFVFESKGILRKSEIKKTPFRTTARFISAIRIYHHLFAQYDICYVNTVVCASAIFALRRRAKGKFIHVREIPSRFQSYVFGALLKYSQAEIIYNSKATAEALGIRGTVIYNGVSKPVFNPPQRETKDIKVRILIIGRINPWKGQQFILDSLSAYGRDINAHIRIVGDVFLGYEHLLDKLQKTALDCAQQVDFVGFSKETDSEIAWSDFVLVPSILPEPFGRVAVESFSAGRPVIASDGGGLREIVSHRVDGFLFEPANGEDFVRTLRNAIALSDIEYERMCSNAKKKYECKFTEANYRECVAKVVSHALDSEAAPA